uniref:Integrase catalytic domain-containing protein n=1 Tax=Fagus sylvatica TaxID=28930 RepID=A0A2N9HH13_FAGSY
MSNLMSIKLDSMNYMLWKLQISAILDAYSMIEHLDGSTQQPRQFVINEDGVQVLNPAFLIWRKKDKALLTLLLSTLSSPVLAMVVGTTTAQEVWNRLEEKFTCTARANVLNLKLELQGIKKGNESISSYLQRIKNTRDKLSAVGVLVDNEELLHMILKGLPKEFAPFASAIRTRDDSISFEKLSVLLQTEEQSMTEVSDPLTNSALAMFVSNNHKPNNGFNGGQGYNRGRGRNSFNRGRGGRSFTAYPTPQIQSSQPSNLNSQAQSSFGSQGKTERPTCQICWKIGHYAIDCYHRMDFAYQGKNPPTKLAAMANASNLQYTHNSETWLTDSGASDHITATASNLNTQAPYHGSEQVTVGNGQNLPIQSIGNTQLHTQYHKFQLKNVLHIPRIASNLMSVHKLCLDNNCSCLFDAQKLLIQDLPTGRLLYKGLSKDGVYPIHSTQFCRSASTKSACLASSSAQKWQLWHSRLGHPSAKVLHTIFPSLSSCNPLDFNSVKSHCKHCLAGKMHQLPFPISTNKVTAPFQIVHADLWGPAPSVSLNGFRFYLVLVDEYTKFTWVYLLTHKSETFTLFKQFTALIHNQFKQSVQIFRTDCGGEFTSTAFNTFCADNGIIHQLSCPHTPQQNGVAERKHKHLIQCALALLSQSNLPISYWSYAVSTAAHLINKLPTPLLSDKSPWESLFHTKPTLSHLRAFGCQCFPLLTPYNKTKLQPKSVPCIFLGYPFTSKGYVCFDPSSHRFYTSRHVLFNETIFPGLSTSQQSTSSSQTSNYSSDCWVNTLNLLHCCTQNPASVSASLDSDPSSQHHVSVSASLDSDLSVPLSNSPTQPLLQQPISPTLISVTSSDSTSPICPSIDPPLLPNPHTTITPATILTPDPILPPDTTTLSLPTASLTPTSVAPNTTSQHPMQTQEEFDALKKQGTWSLVLPPPHKNIVGCKWVYKLKHHSDGTIARYKARLVAKGFHQQHRVDYEETFSPVIKPPTVRLILSLAVAQNWPLRQLDVKNAFLHGTLKEEVYMAQPQGYIDSSYPHHVCKLHKSIYGLKQAPRAWFESFTTQLLQLGFIASAADSSLFIYHHHHVIAYLLLYVDDIVLTSNSTSYLDSLILQLRLVFDLKDLAPTLDSLSMKVNCSLTLMVIEALLVPYTILPSPDLTSRLQSIKFVNTWLLPPPLTSLLPRESSDTLKELCFMALHSLQVLYTCQVYSDADWAGDPDDRRSTSGLLVYLGSNPITWSAKKQATVSRSSTESEYRALASASAEVCWLRTLLKDLGIFLSQPPILWCDNVSVLAIASNPVFHARTKHIEVDFHFIRERVLRKDLVVQIRLHH